MSSIADEYCEMMANACMESNQFFEQYWIDMQNSQEHYEFYKSNKSEMKKGDKGKATITAIQPNGMYQDKYKQEVTLKGEQSGREETVSAFSNTQEPPYKVGDKVEFEITSVNQYGTNARIKKEYNGSRGGSGGQRNQASIIAQFAYREANLMLINAGYPEGVESTSQKIDTTADVAEIILQKLSGLEKKAKENGLG